MTYSPVAGMPTRMQPAAMPGFASGRITRRMTRCGAAPRSFAASSSAGSIRSSATYSGRIMSGRYE